MGVLPDEVIQQIPPLHTQDTRPDKELFAYARVTYDELTWFVLERDTQQDIVSAYLVDPYGERFGYFSFSYMRERQVTVIAVGAEGILGESGDIPIAIGCDPAFTPQLLMSAVKEERHLRHLRGGKGGYPDEALAQKRAYYYAATYDRPAKEVFTKVQDSISNEQSTVELSAFFISPGVFSSAWTIVVLGNRPQEHVHAHIIEALKEGTLTSIPYEILLHLVQRKVEANQMKSWQERHHNVVIKRKQKAKKIKRDPRCRGKGK